jgi:inhibitor of cysteine peptidase
MNEKELIKKSIEENILNKERIRMAAISSGSSLDQGKKGVGFMNKKIFVTAFVLMFCVFSVTAIIQRPTVVSGAYDNPKDYAQIYHLFSQMGTTPGYFDWFGNKSALDDGVPEYSGATDLSGDKGMTDYSDTNLQVEGVQEADVIKTDGKYIYAISTEYLYIVKADNGNLTLVSKIKHLSQSKNGTASFFEMYVVGDKLVALKQTNQYVAYDSLLLDGSKEATAPDNTGSGSVSGNEGSGTEPSPGTDPGLIPEPAPIDIMPIYQADSGTVTAVIFDISDKSSPTIINQLSQKGSYVSSRMVDNNLYLVTNYTVYPNGIEKQDPTTYVPTTTVDGQKEVPVSVDDIYIAPNPDSDSYMTISGIDIQNSGDFVSTKAVLGSASNIYATLDHLYITNYDSVTEDGYYKDKTAIVKFGIKNGYVKKLDTGSVYGTIINQFSMDEYNGNFRIATTQSRYKEVSDGDTTGITTDQGGTSNGLFVLDENLDLIGQTKDLAKGEQIYSVRFDGNTGYVVTFKQTDPLFAIDLSNPANPKVLSALKIPGFSEYMQPFGDGLLFGLGKQTNENSSVTGLKLSMFDVSDKTSVFEIDKTVLTGNYTWSDASYNHKAILVSPKRGLIGFASYDSYFIYHYDKAKGFTLLKQLKIGVDALKMGMNNGTVRGLYIDDVLYVFTGNAVISIDMGNYEKIQTLPLN